jgi:hypothetical protein
MAGSTVWHCAFIQQGTYLLTVHDIDAIVKISVLKRRKGRLHVTLDSDLDTAR